MYTRENDKKLVVMFLIFGGIHLLIAVFSPFDVGAENPFAEFDGFMESAFFVTGVVGVFLCVLALIGGIVTRRFYSMGSATGLFLLSMSSTLGVESSAGAYFLMGMISLGILLGFLPLLFKPSEEEWHVNSFSDKKLSSFD